MPKNTPTDDTDDEARVRPFADWLHEQAGGRSHLELSESLHDLIGRVRDTGKGGSLTFTIKVAPMKKNADALLVSDSINLRLPAHDRKDSIFYTDSDGNLTRSDPAQMAFEGLREIQGGKQAPSVETQSATS